MNLRNSNSMQHQQRMHIKQRRAAVQKAMASSFGSMEDEGPESPVSIFSQLGPKVPPAMKLPKPMVKLLLPKSMIPTSNGPLLPANAVWGLKGRQQWVCHRDQEIVEEFLISEKHESRARLPLKGTGQARAEHKQKAMARGLEKKHWKKVAAARADAREAHEVLLEQEERVQLGDADGGREQPMRAAKEWKGPRMAARRERVARIRREQRCAARDRKCFAHEEPVESLSPEPLPAVEATRPKPKWEMPSAENIPMAPFPWSEPEGPAVAELFRGGVMLSCAAVDDLKVMMADIRAPALAHTIDHAKRARCRAGRNTMAKKMAKLKKLGAGAYLVAPSMVKGQGKRHA